MNKFIKQIPQINIEQATLEDVDDWVCILYQSLQDTYSGYISSEYIKNKEQLREDFLRDLDIGNVATESYMLKLNGHSVGVLKIGKPIRYYSDGHNYYKDNLDDVGEIKSLHINKDYQGHGIGSQAMCFAENRLRQLGYNESSIWVKMQNSNAINFYSKCGYNKTNYINLNTKDKAPSMIMEKKLRILTRDNKYENNIIK